MPSKSPFVAAPDEVVELCEELVTLYHPSLEDASIGLLMRTEKIISNGMVVLGKAKKLPKDVARFVELDFIIWLDYGYWLTVLTPFQQRALLDHELCHCHLPEKGDPKIVPHDIEEFNVIFKRYGFWRPNAGRATEQAIQSRMEFVAQSGKVKAIDPAALREVLLGEVLEGYAAKMERAFAKPVTDEDTDTEPSDPPPGYPSIFDADDRPAEQPANDQDILDQVDHLFDDEGNDGKEEG